MIGLFGFLVSVLWSWAVAELSEEVWLLAIGVERMCGCLQQGLLELLVYVDQKCGFAELPCATMEGFLLQLEC